MRIDKVIAVAAGGVLAVAAMNAPTPSAQHSYTPQQVAEGRALYEANCGRCHNTDGAGVNGVELFKQFRRGNSDEEIAALVQKGIPGTSMPPHAFSTEQALNVVAYMRSMIGVAPGSTPGTPGSARSDAAVVLKGDPARGKTIFTGTGGCAACHRAEGAGGTSGPDLSAIGRGAGRGPFQTPPDPAVLTRSILDPNADIAPAFRMFRVTPRGGAPVRGVLLNQDTFSVQLRDEAQNLRSFIKTDVTEFGFLPSPMPSYRGRLSDQEVADVVSYLLTLKGDAR